MIIRSIDQKRNSLIFINPISRQYLQTHVDLGDAKLEQTTPGRKKTEKKNYPGDAGAKRSTTGMSLSNSDWLEKT